MDGADVHKTADMAACLDEYRCRSCRKLLFKGLLVEGAIEVKCRHCHALTRVAASKFDRLLCMVDPCPGRVPHKPQT